MNSIRGWLLSAGMLVLALVANAQTTSSLALANLRCEYQADPVGIDVAQPRLSWELVSAERGTVQAAYQVRVARSEAGLEKSELMWDSGRQATAASIQIAYQGPPLETGRRYYWQAQVWDNFGQTSGWSQPAFWEMGLLQPADWQVRWITPNLEEDFAKSNPAPLLRRTFQVARTVASARLYATAMGLYELELNGRRVGEDYFTPGWTAYDFRYQYQTYDVTGQIKPGENCLGALLGDGWFRGRLAWKEGRNNYGKQLALLAQLVITYTDGSREVLGTDDRWKATTGAILASDIYDGETYDARLERPGWSQPGYDDKAWQGVAVLRPPAVKLVASGPPVRRIEEIKPVQLIKTPAGETVLDMGQNMVGWVRFRLTAPAGTTITLRHAEILDKAGNLYTENLRNAQQTIRYTARGGGPETFEPHFTFQGFRYVAISGWPGEPRLDAFTGVVVHSQITPTGTFTCSDPLINQLEHNIVWGQKGNFVDIPTDCPQRDERLGWTGDTQVFAPTACFNFDSATFYTKWLKDLALDQQDDGAVPHVIPDVLAHHQRKGESAATGWADSAVIVPWTVYLAYGDRRILEQQYDSMKAWVEYMRRAAGDRYIWNTGEHFGDWLAFATIDPSYPGATTDKDLIQTAYFAHSTEILQQTALVLGRQKDAADYAELLGKIKAAFLKEFVTPNVRLASNTQTAYALVLAFDLLPEPMRQSAAERLAADVRKFKHLTTGFLGTPILCQVLSDTGHLEEAYLLLNRKEYPSWLYPVTRGATTIWERWDGQRPDGTFQDTVMNSFNHYAYGAIGKWLYGVVAGIDIDPRQPGYKHILIQPQPGGGLTYARASLHSMYGRVASSWELKDGKMILQVEIPANATATVRLPRAKLEQVTESGQPLRVAGGVHAVQQDTQTVTAELGSGSYRFAYGY
ncbi:MAG: glycoside hydrolase family 78 protein [Opitutaceae bacterium]